MLMLPYTKYKKADKEWIGDIPAHWSYVALRWISRIYSGGTPDKNNAPFWDNGTIPWVNSGEVNQLLIKEPTTFITEDAYKNSSAKWVSEGSLLIALAGQGKTKGMVAQTAINTTCNQSMAAICPNKNINPRYIFWWLISQYRNIRGLAGNELRDGLNLEMVGSISCPLPSDKEQAQIAAFLDQETARIDQLITKKERQIELLQEKRSTLISHAVTKGLNPRAKMKESGIDWLGEIPEHWKVKKLKYLFKNLDFRRIPLSGEERSYMQKNYPYYGASGIIDMVENFIFEEALLLVAEDGANLLSRSTPLAFTAEGKYWVNNHAHILIKYWEGLLQTFDYTPLISGAAQPKLTAENLANISLPAPPANEQNQIVEFINREAGLIDEMTHKIEKSLDLLCEYRTALIFAAVTGKIDVREEVA